LSRFFVATAEFAQRVTNFPGQIGRHRRGHQPEQATAPETPQQPVAMIGGVGQVAVTDENFAVVPVNDLAVGNDRAVKIVVEKRGQVEIVVALNIEKLAP